MYSGADKGVAKTVFEQWRRQKYNKNSPESIGELFSPSHFYSACMWKSHLAPLFPPLAPRDLIWSLPELIRVSIIITLVPALTRVGKEIPMMRRGWLVGNMESNWE